MWFTILTHWTIIGSTKPLQAYHSETEDALNSFLSKKLPGKPEGKTKSLTTSGSQSVLVSEEFELWDLLSGLVSRSSKKPCKGESSSSSSRKYLHKKIKSWDKSWGNKIRWESKGRPFWSAISVSLYHNRTSSFNSNTNYQIIINTLQ